MDLMTRLRELTAIRGISGREDRVREAIIARIQDHCDTWHVDNMGNLIVEKRGTARPAKKVLFDAHMDEVGFVVTYIEEDGMLRFTPVGGVMPSVTTARRVLVGPDDRVIPGVIGAKPIHLMDAKDRESYVKTDDMLIDIGAPDRAAAQTLVKVGDMITFDSDWTPMGDLVRMRAIDDRVGCALLVGLIQSDLPCDCAFSFSVQEETGCHGAKAAAFAVRPDIAVAVEGTTAGDIHGTPGHKAVCRVGSGPVLSFMDRGTIYTKELYDRALALAEERGIPCQTKEGVFGGNNSRSLQTAAAGARVLAVSVPVRYIHSATSCASPADIRSAMDLLTALAGDLPR